MRHCECLIGATGEWCKATATWCVQVGTRQSDAQDSCKRHLSQTCWAMLQGESRALTVTRVGQR